MYFLLIHDQQMCLLVPSVSYMGVCNCLWHIRNYVHTAKDELETSKKRAKGKFVLPRK